MVSVSNDASHILQKDAVISGGLNTVINGVIGWFMFRGKDAVPLTVDTISAHEKTVFSTGVMTAFILSLILGTIAFSTFGKKAKSLQLAPAELLNLVNLGTRVFRWIPELRKPSLLRTLGDSANYRFQPGRGLDRPFFFFGFRTMLFYSLFTFGTAALVALFLQKSLGTILVTPFVAAILLGIIAGIAAWFINAAVMKAMLPPNSVWDSIGKIHYTIL